MRKIALLVALWACPFFFRAHAAEIHVSSIPALQTAVDSAGAGDVIVLNNGTYSNSAIAIGTGNITVKAATPGGVYLNGTNTITISGGYVTFSGFQFTSGSIGGVVVAVSGDHVVLTQLNFKGYSAQKYISLQGQYDDISYCNFENKPATAPAGNLVHIAPNGVVPNYARIRYCSFRNMPGAGGDNGNECIRIANGAQSTYLCRTIVEYCYFENTGMGDSECISNKSRENVIRYNTFRNNQEAMLCFRNGDNAVAYGNFFINAGGIRVKEANNIFCYNNYFENSGSTGSQGCIRYVYYTANTTNVLNNINFIHNTFVNCGESDLDTGAKDNTWANNIVTSTSGKLFTASSVSGIAWAGNIYQGTLGLAIPSGMTNANPNLVLNADGYYALSPSGPAIDAASANYPAILDIAEVDDDPFVMRDISGRARPANVTAKDVGCTEYAAAGAATNRPLKVSDVGPSYLGGPATNVDASPEKESQGVPSGHLLREAYPNPFNPTTTISYQIPAAAHLSLKIFDQLGAEVTTLVDGMQPAGRHRVQWTAARNPTGAYFCRLQMNTAVETIRLMLVK